MAKTHVDWLELTNNSANPTDADITRGGLAIVGDTLKKYVSGSWTEVEAGTGSSTPSTLTNKTISADSNTITDIGGAEIEDIAGTNATYSVPITIVAVNSGAATTTIFDSNAPFKFRVIDAWAVSTKGGNSGTWNVNDGTDPIVSAVAYGTGDTDIARAAEIDDAKHEIAASGSLKIANSETADTGIIYVQILKITTT
jgi:hypothetical protein